MRSAFFAFLSLFVSFAFASADAATNPGSAFTCVKPLPSDTALLGKVQSQYAKVGTLSSHFTQASYLAALDTAEESSGQMYFQKPGKMRWNYVAPDEQVFIVDEKTLWFYQATDKQVVVDNFSDVLISDLPVAFVMGLGDLSRDFKLKDMCQSEKGIVLNLVPASASHGKDLQGFGLLIDAKENTPKGAKVTDVSGNQTTILFDEQKTNVSVASDIFTPTFPAGVDMIDRRKGAQG